MKKGKAKDFLSIFSDRGFDIPPNAAILDFGCGDGNGVKELRELGYEAYGCDIYLGNLLSNEETKELNSQEIVRIIEQDPYRIPFEDNKFDFAISYQVFEHVQDYQATISELSRVLKPGAVTLHIFPSRYRIKEAHGGIPFGSIIQNYWWLWLCIKLGIRGAEGKKGMELEKIVAKRYEFLNKHTNYLTKKQIHQHFLAYFSDVSFCEKEAFEYSVKSSRPYSKLLKKFAPDLIPLLFGTLGSRAVIAVK